MIPAYFIQEWKEKAPWTEPYMVEQDLIICRALYQRKKGRDLFDLHCALAQHEVDIDKVMLLRPEIKFSPAEAYPLVYKTFIDRMEGKRD